VKIIICFCPSLPPRWGKRAAHNRAQIVYYIAENLELRHDEVAARISAMTGREMADCKREVDLAVQRLFYWGAYADKYGGTVQVWQSLLRLCIHNFNLPRDVYLCLFVFFYASLSFFLTPSLLSPFSIRRPPCMVVPCVSMSQWVWLVSPVPLSTLCWPLCLCLPRPLSVATQSSLYQARNIHSRLRTSTRCAKI
jgi:hypothetical protein